MRYTFSSLMLAAAVLLVCTTQSRGADGDSLTVDKAIALVVRNHPALQRAAQQVEASRALVGVSQSSFYPEVSGSGSYNRIGPVPTISIPGQGSFSFLPEDNWDFFVGVRQLVYDFGRREKGVDLAKSGVVAAQDKEELTRSQLAFTTVKVFYSILYLQQNITVIDDQIGNLNKLLEFTKEKVRTGSGTDFNVLTTRVRVAAAQTRKIDVERLLHNQVTELKRLTGLPAGERLSFAGSFSLPIVSPQADSLIEVALRQRPEMRLARDAVTAATLELKLASLSRRPALNLGVQVGFKNGYFPDLNKLEGNFVVGAGLSVPIFTGFRIENQQKRALADMNAAHANADDIGQQITAEVRQALENLSAEAGKIQTAEIQVRQAKEALRLGAIRYEAGVITNLDLLDSQTRLSEARLAYISAEYGYIISRYALDRATGASIWEPLPE
jgi:outer membrane protein